MGLGVLRMNCFRMSTFLAACLGAMAPGALATAQDTASERLDRVAARACKNVELRLTRELRTLNQLAGSERLERDPQGEGLVDENDLRASVIAARDLASLYASLSCATREAQ